MTHAHNGYRTTRATTASPRQVERELLRGIAARIDGAEGYAPLAAALQENTALWTALAVDLAGDANGLTPELKGGLLGLARFVVAHTRAVLAGEADAAVLSSVNRTVAAGLDPRAASGPAPTEEAA